jgi:ParB-like chromosome segregation protein Spo0J
VDGLAGSMAEIGLKTPLTVREFNGEFLLGPGAHRLAAAKKLGWSEIPCFIFNGDETEFRLWALAENLFRKELTVLERAELINEWRKLVEEKRKAGQIAHPGGDQPHNKDVSGTARELDITREEVRRAAKIARISADALLRIRDKGLDDNQSALLRIADEPPEKQVEKVDELAVRKPRGPQKKPKQDDPPPAPSNPEVPAGLTHAGPASNDDASKLSLSAAPSTPEVSAGLSHADLTSDNAALIAFAEFILARIETVLAAMTDEEDAAVLTALADRARSVLRQRD